MTRPTASSGMFGARIGLAGCAPVGVMLALIGASLGPRPVQARPAQHRYVALSMSVTLDAVGSPDGNSPERHVGEVDQLRLVFDANALDPITKHVPLLNLQHLTPAGFDPPKPDPVRMPMDDAWLDLSKLPYRVHFRAAVTHGEPILIEFDDKTRRLTIHSQGHPADVRLAGPYRIDPVQIHDRTIAAAAVPW